MNAVKDPNQAKTWPELLRGAGTVRDVLMVVRDFLAEWTPEDLKSLPNRCQPPLRFQEPEDVILYAFALAQVRLAGQENEALARMWRFFMDASQRVGIVMERGKSERAANALLASRADD